MHNKKKPNTAPPRGIFDVHRPVEERQDCRGGTLRVFEPFVWLEVDSDKATLSRPTHQRVTHTVRRINEKL